MFIFHQFTKLTTNFIESVILDFFSHVAPLQATIRARKHQYPSKTLHILPSHDVWQFILNGTVTFDFVGI
jgi:hypothetical protein